MCLLCTCMAVMISAQCLRMQNADDIGCVGSIHLLMALWKLSHICPLGNHALYMQMHAFDHIMWASIMHVVLTAIWCNIVLNILAIGMCHMGTCPCAMNSGYYVMHCRFSRCFWPGTWGSTMWMYLELMCCCGIIHKLNVHFFQSTTMLCVPTMVVASMMDIWGLVCWKELPKSF